MVTGDAMYCQKDITEQITDAKADYVFALKGNHPTLYDDVTLFMNTEYDRGNIAYHETINKDHGRIEIRKYALSTDVDWLEQKQEWFSLNAMVMIESTRIIGDKTSTERRYYVSSVTDLKAVAEYIRSHWAIENSQHWVLDVTFSEDNSVKCNRNDRANRALSVMIGKRKTVLNKAVGKRMRTGMVKKAVNTAKLAMPHTRQRRLHHL